MLINSHWLLKACNFIHHQLSYFTCNYRVPTGKENLTGSVYHSFFFHIVLAVLRWLWHVFLLLKFWQLDEHTDNSIERVCSKLHSLFWWQFSFMKAQYCISILIFHTHALLVLSDSLFWFSKYYRSLSMNTI